MRFHLVPEEHRSIFLLNLLTAIEVAELNLTLRALPPFHGWQDDLVAERVTAEL